MTSSARDRSTVASHEGDPGEWLESLLSAVAAAPDFRSAAGVLLAQFLAAVGARRGYVMIFDTRTRELVPALNIGYDDREAPTSRTADDSSDPFILSLLGMQVIACSRGLPRSGVSRTTHLVAIPFPQLRTVNAPRFYDKGDVNRLLLAPCTVQRIDSGDAWDNSPERAAYSPCGVVVLETEMQSVGLDSVAHAARLAGPLLARANALDAHSHRAEELAEQRAVLTSIVNSLPDPIVIIDGNRQIVVQNQRAEHLLSMGELDSEGRRRAVEINNLLLTSHLSKNTALSGTGTGSESRELNMVDPDDGTDLLFEVLAQPLDEDESAIVSVLRDVTDLRRAAGELELQVQRVRLAEYEAKRESDRLNLILTNVADPILVTDDRSNIILMNRQAELLFGAATANIGYATGDRSPAVRANDTKFTTFISDFSLSPESARREDMELERPGDEGETIPMEVIAGKIVDRRGEPLAIVSVLHEIGRAHV